MGNDWPHGKATQNCPSRYLRKSKPRSVLCANMRAFHSKDICPSDAPSEDRRQGRHVFESVLAGTRSLMRVSEPLSFAALECPLVVMAVDSTRHPDLSQH